LEKQEDVEETVGRLGKLKKEIEERINENKILKSKITQDHCLSLQPTKRLESYPLCRRGLQK